MSTTGNEMVQLAEQLAWTQHLPSPMPAIDKPESTYRWGTVKVMEPLTVVMDGDGVEIRPDSLVQRLQVDDRVWVQFHGRYALVLGVGMVIHTDPLEKAVQDATDAAQEATEALALSIIDTKYEYADSTSATTAPTQGWSTTVPTRAKDRYVWQRVVITHGDQTVETTPPVVLTGQEGQPGQPGEEGSTGTSVTSVTAWFRKQDQSAAAPSTPSGAAPAGWSATEPTWQVNTVLWRSDRVAYDNGTYTWTTPTRVAAYEAAVQAWITANGKNSIRRSVNAPTNSAADAGKTVGDVWWQYDPVDGSILRQWQWSANGTWVEQKVAGDLIAYLDAGKINTGSLSGIDFWSPNETANPRVHIGGGVIEVVRSDGERSWQTVSLGGLTDDRMQMVTGKGETVGFDTDGAVSATSVSSTGDADIGGELRAASLMLNGTNIIDVIGDLPRGVIARQKLGSTAAGNTARFGSTNVGYYELFFTPGPGRVVQVRYVGLVYCSAAGRYDFELRSTSHPNPDTLPASPKADGSVGLQQAIAQVWANAPGFYPLSLEAWFGQYSGTYRVLLSAKVGSGSGYGYLASHDNWPSWFVAEDKGTYQGFGDGGYNRGGGTLYSGSAAPAETPPTPTRKTYTSTWNAAWVRSWRGGSVVSDGTLQQGWYGGYQRYSMVGFNSTGAVSGEVGKTIGVALNSGATVSKVEVYLVNKSWWAGAGGKARIGNHGNTSAPANPKTGGSATFDSAQWAAGAGKWVTLPSSWYQYWESGAHTGITLGEGLSGGVSDTFYGKFDATLSNVKLRITYTR